MREKGVLPGSHMADTFNMLRANDLIWNVAVNRYLLGKDAPRSTCCTGTRTRRGCRRRCIRITCGTCIARTTSSSPTRSRSTACRSTWARFTTTLTSSPRARTTSRPGSRVYRIDAVARRRGRVPARQLGHIAGIINPPGKEKGRWWDAPTNPPTPEAWLAKSATRHAGSWWPDWLTWMKARSGRRVVAPAAPGSPEHPPLAPAPGTYVLESSNEDTKIAAGIRPGRASCAAAACLSGGRARASGFGPHRLREPRLLAGSLVGMNDTPAGCPVELRIGERDRRSLAGHVGFLDQRLQAGLDIDVPETALVGLTSPFLRGFDIWHAADCSTGPRGRPAKPGAAKPGADARIRAWAAAGRQAKENPLTEAHAPNGSARVRSPCAARTGRSLAAAPAAAASRRCCIRFPGAATAAGPSAASTFDAAGDLYGTTHFGGITSCGGFVGGGCGVVFG